MTLTIDLPESVAQELGSRHISDQQIRAFVIQVVEAWLRIQSTESATAPIEKTGSRFTASATGFAEKLVRENRELFERLANL
ncbi:MAG: hypothetical protein HZC40_06225 [Chloroflexi bacterium]|nr:hypothetical protein [Chloroflexota bacterium]